MKRTYDLSNDQLYNAIGLYIRETFQEHIDFDSRITIQWYVEMNAIRASVSIENPDPPKTQPERESTGADQNADQTKSK